MNAKALLGLAVGLFLVAGESPNEPFYYEPPYNGPNFSVTHRDIVITGKNGVYDARVTVKNTGRRRGRDVVVYCWLEREHETVTKKSTTLERVPADREKTVDCPLGKLGPGDYFFRVKEVWDKRSDLATVEFKLPGPNVRTLPQHIWVMPTAPWPGEAYTIRMGILNDGQQEAHNVAIGISVENSAGKQMGASEYFELADVDPGEEVSKEVAMPGLPAGQYHIVVRVNTSRSFKEVRDKDNRTVKPLLIEKPLTSLKVSPKPVILP